MKSQVMTKYGMVVGVEKEGIVSFKGVPYAQPPVGALRFKPPQPPMVWQEPLLCEQFGNSAMQQYDVLEYACRLPRSEDCLTLNIWGRNDESAEKKPVMVFIHGGACISGGTGDPLYDGENFVKRHDVIMVTINYRINVFGFLDLEEFGGAEYKESKNLGILDQVQALRWLQENIQYFNGDSQNITIFGESAGGASVSLLMVLPQAKGLFQKAIIQSGTFWLCRRADTDTYTKEIARTFLKIAKAKDMQELLSFSAEKINDCCGELFAQYEEQYDGICMPVLDGEILPKNPLQKIRQGCAKDVKLLIGTNEDELKYWSLYYPNLDDTILELLDGLAKVILDRTPMEEERKQKYLRSKAQYSAVKRAYMLANDWFMRDNAIALAQEQSRYNDTYMYYFTWKSRHEGLGACHAVELPFVFHNLDTPSGQVFTGANPPEKLADNMQDAWAAFAKEGTPNHHSIPKWNCYEEHNRYTMLIDETFTQQCDPRKEDRELLADLFV